MTRITSTLFFLSAIMLLENCANNESKNTEQKVGAGITKTAWGTVDGQDVDLFTLTNNNGMQVKISNYGGTIACWMVTDKNGNRRNIVVGFDSLSGYLAKPPYFGATIGRYGNRI